MIDSATPWKEELLKVAKRLRKRTTQRWYPRTSFLIERDVMVSAYAIRRLIDAHKVSDSMKCRQLSVTQYDLVDRVPEMWDRYMIESRYNLRVGTRVELTPIKLCNKMIHSWIWLWSAQTAEFDGIFLSDEKQKSRLYFVSADLLIDLFYAVGADDCPQVLMRRDTGRSTQVMRVTARDLETT
jgi:urease gamma subunit